MSDFEAQLDALANAPTSEVITPHIKGGSIEEISSRDFESLPVMSNTGKYDFNSGLKTGEEDAKLYEIRLVNELIDFDVLELCSQKRAGGKNTFCLKKNCTIDHRNQNAAPVLLDEDAIVVLKSQDVAFLEPIGSMENVSDKLLKEWRSQPKTLNEWSILFMLSKQAETKVTASDIVGLKDFSEKASKHRTPSKPSKLESKIDTFQSQHDWKTWESEVLSGKTSLNLSGSNFSETVEKQFSVLESAVQDVVSQVNKNNENLTKSMRMLEFEKNKLKADIGKREDAVIDPDFESSTIWLTLAALSDGVKNSSPTTQSSVKFAPEQVSRSELDAHLQSMKKYCEKQDSEIRDLKIMVRTLSNRIVDMESKWANEFPPRMHEVVVGLSNLKDNTELANEVKELKRDLSEIKPSKGATKVKF